MNATTVFPLPRLPGLGRVIGAVCNFATGKQAAVTVDGETVMATRVLTHGAECEGCAMALEMAQAAAYLADHDAVLIAAEVQRLEGAGLTWHRAAIPVDVP